jgi:hypothetical protein
MENMTVHCITLTMIETINRMTVAMYDRDSDIDSAAHNGDNATHDNDIEAHDTGTATNDNVNDDATHGCVCNA